MTLGYIWIRMESWIREGDIQVDSLSLITHIVQPNIVQTHSPFTLSLVDTSEIPHLPKILDWVKFGGNVCISHEYFTQWWFTLSSMKNYNKLIFVILADSVDIFSNKGKTVRLLTSFAFCTLSSMTTRWQMRLTRGFLLYRWTLNAFADGRGKRRTEG